MDSAESIAATVVACGRHSSCVAAIKARARLGSNGRDTIWRPRGVMPPLASKASSTHNCLRAPSNASLCSTEHQGVFAGTNIVNQYGATLTVLQPPQHRAVCTEHAQSSCYYQGQLFSIAGCCMKQTYSDICKLSRLQRAGLYKVVRISKKQQAQVGTNTDCMLVQFAQCL